MVGDYLGIYIILLISVLISIFLEINYSNLQINEININIKKISFFVCFFVILIIGVLRSENLGVDVDNYKIYFDFYSSVGVKYFASNYKYDIGFVLLNKFIRIFTDNFRIFENVVFLICHCIFSYIIYKRSDYPALSFLIYIGLGFLGFNLCILRQAIAYSICFLSFDYLKNDKMIKYLMLVILALSFHKTAIFFIISYFISREKYNNLSLIKKIVLIALSTLTAIFLLPKLYIFYANDYSDISISGQGYKLLLLYILLSLILKVVLNINEKNINNKDYEVSFGSIYFQIVSLKFSVFTRVANYYSLLFTISIPNIINSSKYKKLLCFIFAFIFSMMYIYILFTDGCEIVPYEFFFA